jgi:hypothetical protein
MNIREQNGKNKFKLARRILPSTEKSGVHVHQVKPDRDECKDLILNHLRSCGDSGAPLREIQLILPGFSRKQLQLLLNDLRNSNAIIPIGKTKGTRWFYNN